MLAASTARSKPPPLGLAIVGGVFCAVALGAYFGFDLDYAGSPWSFAIAGGPTVLAALAAVGLTFREGEPARWLKPVWGDPTRGILSAAALVLLAVGFVHVVASVGSPRESWMARLYLQIGSPAHIHSH